MGLFSFMFISVILKVFLFRGTFAVIYSLRQSESISDDGSTLVSKDGIFEMGFFSPNSSKNRYVGIWYKKIPVQTVVWVANRCNPIKDSSGLLMINIVGNLVLLGQNNSVIWSTSSLKQAQKPLVQLLDNGNLVVSDETNVNSENYLWQSFDYPSDTFLPGMKLGYDFKRGLPWRLSAWKSYDDPCNGDLTHGFEINEELHIYPEAAIQNGSVTYYRTGPWNGLSFSGAPDLRPNLFFDFGFVYNDDEISYSYNLKNKSIITILVLNQTTSVSQRLMWIETEKIWRPYISFPRDMCDNYGLCGANGNCIMSESPVCQCLKGFIPKSPENWNTMDWSQGCVRTTELRCGDKRKDGFVKFSDLKMPDTQHTWVNKSMNLDECKEKCMSNCSCMAYANSDIRGQGSGCVLWFGDLLDIRQYPFGQQDLFIRMSASEIDFLLHNSERSRADHLKRVAIITSVLVEVVCGIIIVGLYILRRRNLKENTERNVIISMSESQEEDLDLPSFALPTISAATNNFSESNKLGEGGFGPVYKGMLEEGQEIAVKRLSINSGQGVNEFKNEVKLILKLQHRNLVRLLGCCIKGEEKLLVYEYMPNKSLDSFIFEQKQGKLLDWPQRFQIVCGIARGLLYLHHDSRLRIIHRDLKASNVLLDKDMNPKISDFGLARTFGGDQIEGNTNRVVGTYGYMAPEYAFHGLFSIKSDVFSFGILVLEIITGKRSRGFYCGNQDLTLIGRAYSLMKEGKAFDLIDKHLRDSYENMEEVLRCIHVSLLCVQHSPLDRPNISSVILMLSGESVLPQPKPPGYFMLADNWEGDDSFSSQLLQNSSSS